MNVKTWSVALLCGAALALPVAAQEEAPPKEEPAAASEGATKPAEAPKKKGYEEPALHRWGAWTITLAAWAPTLVGADEEVAVVFPDGKIPYTVEVGATDSIRESWQVAYHLPKNVGSIVGRYDSMRYDDNVAKFTPGEFQFFESRAFPVLRGGFDDGFADGVRTHAVRKSRIATLTFSRTVADTKHARVTWGAGMQNIDHSRDTTIHYLAIVPNLPPVIPPIVPEPVDPATLNPRPDIVEIKSDYSGNGLAATIDVEFPLHPRISIVSGLAVGLMRGDVSTVYTSRNSYYVDERDPGHVLTKDELFALLSGGQSDVESVAQRTILAALQTSNVSRSAQTYDVYLGVQANVWRGLKVFATYRDIYFANAGAYTLPTVEGTVTTDTLSSAYDGYMLGLSWRF